MQVKFVAGWPDFVVSQHRAFPNTYFQLLETQNISNQKPYDFFCKYVLLKLDIVKRKYEHNRY